MEIGYEPTSAPSTSLLYSSISRRFGALVIDFFIVAIMGGFAAHIIPVIGGIAVWFFYAPILESSALRGTIGKHLMGIQVVDLAGHRISLRASLIRNVMKLVSSAICLLGYVFAFFSSRKQTLHDILAETVVVYGRSEAAIADAWVDSTKELFRSQGLGSVSTPPPTGYTEPADLASQLERLKAMRDRGELTEDEFQAAKAKVLRG